MAHFRKEMISFFLTTKCNLSCKYCYTNKEDFLHQTLDFEFAKAGINDFFKKSSSRHIRFFGAGEPTCQFDRLREIFDYAYSIAGDELTVELQTNGYFNEEIREWISKNVDIVWISCDSVPYMTDYYRFNDGDIANRVYSNVKYLTNHGKTVTGIRSTITSKNVNTQVDIVDYFSSIGVKTIWTDPIFPAVGSNYNMDEPDLMEYAAEFLKAEKLAKKNGVYYGSILTCNFDENVEHSCRACLPVPHLTTDGYVSACDMALFGEDAGHMDVFIYGKWDEESKTIEYDHEKMYILNSRKAKNMKKCQGCEAINHCAGYCLGEVVNETRDLFGVKSKVCRPIRFLLANSCNVGVKYDYTHP